MAARIAHQYKAQQKLLDWGLGRGFFKTREAADGMGVPIDSVAHTLRRMLKEGRAIRVGEVGKGLACSWQVKGDIPFVPGETKRLSSQARKLAAMEAMPEAELMKPQKDGYYPDWPVRTLLEDHWGMMPHPAYCE